MDPATLSGIAALISSVGGLFDSGGSQTTTQEMQPSDLFSMSRIGGAGSGENDLVALQQALFGSGAREILQTGMPGELNAASLAGGRLSSATGRRLDQAAFGGLNEGLRRASAIAQERAGARGIGMSSIEGIQEAELQRPLIENAAGLRASLEQSELSRLSGLRENLMGNLLRMQDSPALNRLLQLRMAEQNQLQLSRFPGGLPDFVKGELGIEGGMSTATQRKQQLQNEILGLKQQLKGDNSWKGKQRIYQEMRRIEELWKKEFPNEEFNV